MIISFFFFWLIGSQFLDQRLNLSMPSAVEAQSHNHWPDKVFHNDSFLITANKNSIGICPCVDIKPIDIRQMMGRQRDTGLVGLDCETIFKISLAILNYRQVENIWRREWLPTPVFVPGEFHEQRILVGYSPWGSQSQI